MQIDKSSCCDYYKKEAGVYDSRRFYCKCRKYYDELLKETVFQYVKDAKVLLDAGTGTGRFAIYLAKKGKRVIALDQSNEMLEVARQKSIEEGVSDLIEFVQGDIEELPFEAGKFDAIVSIHVMTHFRSVRKIVSEFSRVLKPNGTLVFDLSESRIARLYHFLRTYVINKSFSFPDYYRKLRDLKGDLDGNGIVVVTFRKVKKLPRFLVHMFICVFRSVLFLIFLKRMENLNYGAVTLLKCKKTQ